MHKCIPLPGRSKNQTPTPTAAATSNETVKMITATLLVKKHKRLWWLLLGFKKTIILIRKLGLIVFDRGHKINCIGIPLYGSVLGPLSYLLLLFVSSSNLLFLVFVFHFYFLFSPPTFRFSFYFFVSLFNFLFLLLISFLLQGFISSFTFSSERRNENQKKNRKSGGRNEKVQGETKTRRKNKKVEWEMKISRRNENLEEKRKLGGETKTRKRNEN